MNRFGTGIDDALPTILQRDGPAFLAVSGVRCPGFKDTPRELLRYNKVQTREELPNPLLSL